MVCAAIGGSTGNIWPRMAVNSDRGGAAYSGSAGQAVGPYLRAVLRHWRLVVLVTLLAVAVAVATLTRISPTYDASASILVTPLPQGGSSFVGIATVVETGDPARNVQTAAALIDTPESASLAAHELGKGWTPAQVLSAVSVTPLGASEVLAVTAQASTADEAARVANAFARGAIASRASVVQHQIAIVLASLDARLAQLPPASAEAQALAATISQLRAIRGSGREPTMSVSQTALPPGGPSGTPRWLIILLAMVGGFALGSIAALGVEAFRPSVRDREDAVSLYPLPVLATVPRINGSYRRRGAAPWTFTPVAFEQMRMVRDQLAISIPNPVILLTSAGPGDGKTTVAAALAAAFAERDEEVILIDLDLRKPDLSTLLDIRPNHRDPGSAGVLLQDALVPVPRLPGVKVLPAPVGDVATFEILIRRLPDVLARARQMAGCVIVDSAPVGVVSEALRIARHCDQVLFVIRRQHTRRREVSLARELLERTDAPVAGMVLVGEDPGNQGRGYGYGYTTTPNGIISGPLIPAAGSAETRPKRVRPAPRRT
jgi:Mrp family chromosome partitioning ATPase/capsular polysaccharide biosynthesis protein